MFGFSLLICRFSLVLQLSVGSLLLAISIFQRFYFFFVMHFTCLIGVIYFVEFKIEAVAIIGGLRNFQFQVLDALAIFYFFPHCFLFQAEQVIISNASGITCVLNVPY